ncbi:MAG: chromate resistance protein ChrB domain-containing protein [Myxococcota bacterium]
MSSDPNPWLLSIHRLPARPPYLRVKVWRRLQAVGAVAVQNAVYVLPNTDACREHFEWVVREVQQHGGDASVCEARLVEGFGDEQLRAAFIEARERDYRALTEEARKLLEAPAIQRGRKRRPPNLALTVQRLRRQKADVEAIDFFSAPGGDRLERLIARLERRFVSPTVSDNTKDTGQWRRSDLQGRTWVTRKGIHVDRIASAWLIREFIDPEAHFKFVDARGYRPLARELRFDMYEAEFTHDGSLCTFEVLLRELGLSEPGLRAIGEIVHAIDLKDDEPTRPETLGVAHTLEGIARRHKDDEARLRDGAALFGALYAYFRAERGKTQ